MTGPPSRSTRVGQNYLRVSGTTASGAPGRLGTVTLHRSATAPTTRAPACEGEATVYLLPPAPELAPIAVDDTVVVRAGAQIDIPVLENDIVAGRRAPDAQSRRRSSSSTPDALAFASGDLLRYLAPTSRGSTTIEYSVFTTGAPALADTATVRVQRAAPTTRTAPRCRRRSRAAC